MEEEYQQKQEQINWMIIANQISEEQVNSIGI